jgi:pimeloyl-ACP methyl ester carboxylesterase
VQLSHIRKGSGDPLLLIHGLGSQYRVWEPVIDRLAAEYEVIGIDLPGFGDSPPLPEGTPVDAEHLTDAVASFLDDLGWETPHVAGNSLGGWIGLELAKRGRARSVAAIGPAGFGNKRERAFTVESLRLTYRVAHLTYGAAPRMLSSAIGRKLALSQVFARPERMTTEAAVGAVRNFADSRGVPRALEALRHGHFSGGESIAVPVTMIWGERELLLPRRDRQAARSIASVPGARLVWLQGCGHTPTWDDPPALAQAILDGCVPSSSPSLSASA